jgi:hypothetical protein
LISARTVAAVIGWLFVLATVGCLLGLRQSSLARLTAGAVTLCSGLFLVYMAHFEWTAIASMPSAYAYSDPKVIEAPTPALAAALGMKEVVIPDMPKAATPTRPVFAVASAPHLRAQPAACAALTGIESLQCARCSEKERPRVDRLPRERASRVLRRATLRRRNLPVAVSTVVPRVKPV